MQQSSTYKYLSFLFAVIALVFAVLYFTKPEPTVEDIYTEATTGLESCNQKLGMWQHDYATTTATEKQAALDSILEDCRDTLSETSENLSE